MLDASSASEDGSPGQGELDRLVVCLRAGFRWYSIRASTPTERLRMPFFLRVAKTNTSFFSVLAK